MSVYQNGKQSAISQPVASYSVNISRKASQGDDNALNDLEDCEDFVISEKTPDYTSKSLPQPQIEFKYTGQSPFSIYSYEIDYTSEV